MPTFGAFGAWPLKFGSRPNRVKVLYDALNQARGTAYDTSDDSNVTAETYAEAVMLDVAWSINKRLAYQWDPVRMTDLVPRWEAIFDLHPSVTDSDPARRGALQAKFLALTGRPSLEDVVSAMLGDSFVDIEYTPLAQAYQRWPDNGFQNDWISHTAHILIRVQYGPTQTDAEFLRLMAKMNEELRNLLPAFITFDWGMYAENGLDGFWLDDPLGAGPPPFNLDYEVFDS